MRDSFNTEKYKMDDNLPISELLSFKNIIINTSSGLTVYE